MRKSRAIKILERALRGDDPVMAATALASVGDCYLPVSVLAGGSNYQGEVWHMAAVAGAVRCLGLMASLGVDVDRPGMNTPRTALQQAASAGCVLSVELLLALGAEPGVRDPAGRSAHDLAAPGRNVTPAASARIRELLTAAGGGASERN